MADMTQFTIGAELRCSDGCCAAVTRVVIDPVARAVTHLVIEPKQRWGLGRLVPLDLVDTTGDELRLRCSGPELEKLPAAEETQFLPGISGYEGYGPGDLMSWPYYGLGGNVAQPVVYDKVPLGEVAVRRGERVHATDGDIGRVQGLVIDPRDRHVTHVLLQEGHLWGRKEVAIPISAVVGVGAEGIQLRVTKHDVQELPAVNLDRPVR